MNKLEEIEKIIDRHCYVETEEGDQTVVFNHLAMKEELSQLIEKEKKEAVKKCLVELAKKGQLHGR